MDAMLDKSAVQLIEQIREDPMYDVVNNIYKNYEGYKMNFHFTSVKNLGDEYIVKIGKALVADKTVVSYCGSKKVVDEILKEYGSRFKILAFHGVGYEQQEDSDFKIHEEFKEYYTNDTQRIIDEQP